MAALRISWLPPADRSSPNAHAKPGAWSSLPPLARTAGPIQATAQSIPFVRRLAIRRPPSISLAPLRHELSLRAPHGLVSGISRVVARSQAEPELEFARKPVLDGGPDAPDALPVGEAAATDVSTSSSSGQLSVPSPTPRVLRTAQPRADGGPRPLTRLELPPGVLAREPTKPSPTAEAPANGVADPVAPPMPSPGAPASAAAPVGRSAPDVPRRRLLHRVGLGAPLVSPRPGNPPAEEPERVAPAEKPSVATDPPTLSSVAAERTEQKIEPAASPSRVRARAARERQLEQAGERTGLAGVAPAPRGTARAPLATDLSASDHPLAADRSTGGQPTRPTEPVTFGPTDPAVPSHGGSEESGQVSPRSARRESKPGRSSPAQRQPGAGAAAAPSRGGEGDPLPGRSGAPSAGRPARPEAPPSRPPGEAERAALSVPVEAARSAAPAPQTTSGAAASRPKRRDQPAPRRAETEGTTGSSQPISPGSPLEPPLERQPEAGVGREDVPLVSGRAPLVAPVAGGQVAAGPGAKRAARAPGAAAGAAPPSAGDGSVPAARPAPARVDRDDAPATRAVGGPSPPRSPAPAARAGAAAAPSRAEEGDPAPTRSAAPAPQTTSGAAASRPPRRDQAAPRRAETEGTPGSSQPISPGSPLEPDPERQPQAGVGRGDVPLVSGRAPLVKPVAGGLAGPIAKQAAPAPGAAAGATPPSAGDGSVPAARRELARVDRDDAPATRPVGGSSPLRSPAPAAKAVAAAAPSRAEEPDKAPSQSAAPAPQTTSGAATSRPPRRDQAAPRGAETAPGTGQNATAPIPAAAARHVAGQSAAATAAEASAVDAQRAARPATEGTTGSSQPISPGSSLEPPAERQPEAGVGREDVPLVSGRAPLVAPVAGGQVAAGPGAKRAARAPGAAAGAAPPSAGDGSVPAARPAPARVDRDDAPATRPPRAAKRAALPAPGTGQNATAPIPAAAARQVDAQPAPATAAKAPAVVPRRAARPATEGTTGSSQPISPGSSLEPPAERQPEAGVGRGDVPLVSGRAPLVKPVAGGLAGSIAKQAAPAAGAAAPSAGDVSAPAAPPGPARVDRDDAPAARAVGGSSPLRSPAPAATAGAAAAPSRPEEGDAAPGRSAAPSAERSAPPDAPPSRPPREAERAAFSAPVEAARSAAPAPQTRSGPAASRPPGRDQAAPRGAETAPGTGQNATAPIPAAARQVAGQSAAATAAAGLGDPVSLAERSIAASRPLSGARRLGSPTLRAPSPQRPDSPADEPRQPRLGRPELQASGGGRREMPGAAAAPAGRTRLVPQPHASAAARARSAVTADNPNSVNRSRSSTPDDSGSVTPEPAAATAIPKRAIATMPAPSSPPTPPSAAPRAAVVQRATSEPRLGASERTTEYEFDQLADRLYGRISARLRGELRIDRERLGLAADLR